MYSGKVYAFIMYLNIVYITETIVSMSFNDNRCETNWLKKYKKNATKDSYSQLKKFLNKNKLELTKKSVATIGYDGAVFIEYIDAKNVSKCDHCGEYMTYDYDEACDRCCGYCCYQCSEDFDNTNENCKFKYDIKNEKFFAFICNMCKTKCYADDLQVDNTRLESYGVCKFCEEMFCKECYSEHNLSYCDEKCKGKSNLKRKIKNKTPNNNKRQKKVV